MNQNTFLEEQLEYIYISEAFSDIMDKFKAPARLKDINSALKTKNTKNIMRSMSFIPTMKSSKIKRIASDRVEGFSKNYRDVSRKFSADIPLAAKEMGSVVIAYIYSARDILKKRGVDVGKINKALSQIKEPFYRKYEEELFSAAIMSLIVAALIYIIPQVIGVVIYGGVLLLAVIGSLIFIWIFKEVHGM